MNTLNIYKTALNVSNEIVQETSNKEDFIEDSCSKGEKLNLTLLKQKTGEFLSTWVR